MYRRTWGGNVPVRVQEEEEESNLLDFRRPVAGSVDSDIMTSVDQGVLAGGEAARAPTWIVMFGLLLGWDTGDACGIYRCLDCVLG